MDAIAEARAAWETFHLIMTMEIQGRQADEFYEDEVEEDGEEI